MNKELALRTFAYLIGHYKTHEETIINSQEIEAINYILDENERLENQLKKQKEIIDKVIEYIENGDLLYLANKNSVVYRDNVEIKAVADRLNELLQILEDKEVE